MTAETIHTCSYECDREASAPVGVRNAILEALNLVHAEGRARVESATAEMADRLAALTQQPAAVDEADTLLRDLVEALDAAFISSWQSTAAWQKQLDAAREYLAAQQQGGT